MFKILFKYGLVTALNYFILFFGTFLFVEIFDFSPVFSYFMLISFVYLLTFILYTKFVFSSSFDKKIFLKFVVALLVFWLLNNLFYNFMLKILMIQYLLAVLINIIFWGTIRFFVYKNFVFSTNHDAER